MLILYERMSKFLIISNTKNLYERILDAQNTKIAKTPLLGVVLDNLRVKY